MTEPQIEYHVGDVVRQTESVRSGSVFLITRIDGDLFYFLHRHPNGTIETDDGPRTCLGAVIDPADGAPLRYCMWRFEGGQVGDCVKLTTDSQWRRVIGWNPAAVHLQNLDNGMLWWAPWNRIAERKETSDASPAAALITPEAIEAANVLLRRLTPEPGWSERTFLAHEGAIVREIGTGGVRSFAGRECDLTENEMLIAIERARPWSISVAREVARALLPGWREEKGARWFPPDWAVCGHSIIGLDRPRADAYIALSWDGDSRIHLIRACETALAWYRERTQACVGRSLLEMDAAIDQANTTLRRLTPGWETRSWSHGGITRLGVGVVDSTVPSDTGPVPRSAEELARRIEQVQPWRHSVAVQIGRVLLTGWREVGVPHAETWFVSPDERVTVRCCVDGDAKTRETFITACEAALQRFDHPLLSHCDRCGVQIPRESPIRLCTGCNAALERELAEKSTGTAADLAPCTDPACARPLRPDQRDQHGLCAYCALRAYDQDTDNALLTRQLADGGAISNLGQRIEQLSTRRSNLRSWRDRRGPWDWDVDLLDYEVTG